MAAGVSDRRRDKPEIEVWRSGVDSEGQEALRTAGREAGATTLGEMQAIAGDRRGCKSDQVVLR